MLVDGTSSNEALGLLLQEEKAMKVMKVVDEAVKANKGNGEGYRDVVAAEWVPAVIPK